MLNRRSSLTRSPLARSSGGERVRTPRKRSRSGPTDTTRQGVYERDGFACCRCTRPVSDSTPVSIHHRTPRGMGGTRAPSINEAPNLLLLCGSGTTGCHGWVEGHRDDARRDGFLVASWEAPETVPFRDLAGDWWLLPDKFERILVGVGGQVAP